MKKILIVDDSAFTRGIHRRVLESVGYVTIEAGGGVEALDSFEKEKPDLAMVDLLMPDMDGMDVIKKILEIDPDAKTVICSSDKQKARQQDAKELGAKAFIPKPADAEKMVATIQEILKDQE